MQTVSRYYSNAFTGEKTRVRITLFLLSSNDTCPAKSVFLWDKTKLLSDLMKDAICVLVKIVRIRSGICRQKKESHKMKSFEDEVFYFYRKLVWGAANKDISFDFGS